MLLHNARRRAKEVSQNDLATSLGGAGAKVKWANDEEACGAGTARTEGRIKHVLEKTKHATKFISGSSNENVLLLCADFRFLFRQFATIYVFNKRFCVSCDKKKYIMFLYFSLFVIIFAFLKKCFCFGATNARFCVYLFFCVC